MSSHRTSRATICLGLIAVGALLLVPARTSVAAGTVQVAWPGKPVAAVTNWSAGVLELVNDPLRTTGWNPGPSRSPQTVSYYELKVRNTDEVNRLIQKLAAIKAPKVQVRLNPGKEATYLTPATVFMLPAGNGTSVVFSVDNQEGLDAWYYLGTYTPWPPTLTIYVGHDAIELKKLNVPPTVEVLADVVWASGNATPSSAVLKGIEEFIFQHNKAKASRPTKPQSGVHPASP
jgi:hypothetical protein